VLGGEASCVEVEAHQSFLWKISRSIQAEP